MFAKVKTQHARKPVTAIVAIILVASVFAAACQPSSQQGNLQIDRVISFHFHLRRTTFRLLISPVRLLEPSLQALQSPS